MFSAAPVNCLFIHGSNNWDSVVFHNEGFGDIKDHSFRATPFQKKICYGSFEFVSTFHKKVFSGAPVKCLFLYGSNNSDCVISGNAAFGETKDHSLRTTPFQKKICHGSCEFVSTLSKKVFLGAPVKCVFLWEWLYTRQSGTQNLNSKCPAFQKFRLQVTGTRHINSKCPAL